MTSVADLLEQKKDVLTVTPSNRVQCLLTGHEMPLNTIAIQQHLSSNKFKKAQEWYSKDYSIYLPYLVPHKSGDSRKLFCILTRTTLNKIPKEIKKHVEGKKFKRLKEEYEAKKSSGEPIEENSDSNSESTDIWQPDEENIESFDEEEEEEMSESESQIEVDENEDNDSVVPDIVSEKSKKRPRNQMNDDKINGMKQLVSKEKPASKVKDSQQKTKKVKIKN